MVARRPASAVDPEVDQNGDTDRNLQDLSSTDSALGRLLRMVWLVPSMDRLWIEGAEGRRRFLDRMTMTFEPGHAEAALAWEKAMRERNRLLKEGVGDPAWYGALEAQMAEAEWIYLEGYRFDGPESHEAFAKAMEGGSVRLPRSGRALVYPSLADQYRMLLEENRVEAARTILASADPGRAIVAVNPARAKGPARSGNADKAYLATATAERRHKADGQRAIEPGGPRHTTPFIGRHSFGTTTCS